MDLMLAEIVLPRVLSAFNYSGRILGTAEEGINDNLRLFIAHACALMDGRFEVDIVDGTSVHEDTFALPDVRWENKWDRCGADGGLRQLLESNIGLIKFCVDTTINIHGGNGDCSLVIAELRQNVLQVGQKRGVIDDSTHHDNTAQLSKRPVSPDIAAMKIVPKIAEPLCHLNFRAFFPSCHCRGIDGACRDTGQNIILVVRRGAVVGEAP